MALLPSDPRQQRMLLVGVAALGLAGVYDTLLAGPKRAELTEIAAHVDSLELANVKAGAAAKNGNAAKIRAEAAAYRRDLDVLRQLVPMGNEVPALLEQVSTAARRAGLDISSVQPEPVVAGEMFDTYRYRISMAGTYHPLGEFLVNVGSLTRIVAPVNLQLQPAPAEASTSRRLPANAALLTATFEIQTYVAKGTERGPVAPRAVAAATDSVGGRS